MTSTNDGKDVKSIQTSGQTGKKYYIELYNSLDARLSGACELRERTAHLCSAWVHIHSICRHANQASHPPLLAWLEKHTAKIVLQTEWQSPKSKDEHTTFAQGLDTVIGAVEAAIADRHGNRLPWEVQLLSRAEWFKGVLSNPWDHPVLRALLDSGGATLSDDEVLEWLKGERDIVFTTRLVQLVAGKCNDLATSLVSAIMDRARAGRPLVPDAEQIEDPKDKPASSGESAFETVLRNEAGFADEAWALITDIEFVLLHKTNQHARCIQLAKQTPLRTGYELVQRLQKRLENAKLARDKKLWKNSNNVAIVVAQAIIARCMRVPSCLGTVRAALYCCTRALVVLLPPATLRRDTATLTALAGTSQHLYWFARAVDAQRNTEDMKPVVCELYVRALTFGMNELEQLKLNNKKEQEARKTEQILATWFLELGSLFTSARFKCECTLTAFSVHPTPTMYKKIMAAPALPPVGIVTDVQESKAETNSEYGSWASDSRAQTNFVKTSETLNLKHTQHQANVLSTAIVAESEALGLGGDLCHDIVVLLAGPRVKTLSWDMDRELLLQNCRTYMERTHGGTRALTTELRYLKLGPNDFQHLPEEEDDDSDIYYGIEKGYEHLVEFQEAQPEAVWEDSLWLDNETASDSSSNTASDHTAASRKKKVKRRVKSSDDESDPLSLVAEAKRIEKKKERPHSKERSKEKRKSKKEVTQVSEKKEKKSRKKKDKADKESDGKPNSLSGLIGIKVARVSQILQAGKTDDNKASCVTDSDYDSQGKSSLASLNSEEVETDIVYDGQFSMDELKSPEKQPGSVPKSTKNQELSTSSEVATIAKPQITDSSNKVPVLASSVNPVLCPKSEQNKKVPNSSEDVKNRISKLLQFRRHKSSTSEGNSTVTSPAATKPEPTLPIQCNTKPDVLSSLVGAKVIKAEEASKVIMNKKQTDQLNKLAQEVNSLLPHSNNTMRPLGMKIHHTNKDFIGNVENTCSRALPVKFDYKIPSLPVQPSNPLPSTTQLNVTPQATTNTAIKPISEAPVPDLKPLSPPQSKTPPRPAFDAQQKSFQDFLKDLQGSINAGLKSTKAPPKPGPKKEPKPRVKTTPCVPKAISALADSAVADTTAASPQCAKPIVQQKKSENAPNTFARLSYMHKKQGEIKPKQTVDPMQQLANPSQLALQNSISAELDQRIADLRLNKLKHLHNKGLVITRSDHQAKTATPKVPLRVETQKIGQPTEYSVLSMLNSNSASLLKRPIVTTESQPKNLALEQPRKILAPASSKSALSESDQQDLLLLLRQQSKLNAPVTQERAEPSTNKIIDSLRLSNISISTSSKYTATSSTNAPSINKPINAACGIIKGQYENNNTKISHTTIMKTANLVQNKLNISQQPKQMESVLYAPQNITSEAKKTRIVLQSNKVLNQKADKKVSEKKQDWTSVLDALRQHKTPSRGPNALDMFMKRDSYEKYTNDKMQNQRLIKTVDEAKPATCTNILDTVANPKSNYTKNNPYDKYTNPQYQMTTKAVSEVTVIKTGTQTNLSETTPKSKSNVVPMAANNRKPLLKQSDVPNRQNHPGITKSHHMLASKVVCDFEKEDDPFISGIRNSDYDLLEELMDDDLRQEIGELSSDEERYDSPMTAVAKGSKITSNVNIPIQMVDKTITPLPTKEKSLIVDPRSVLLTQKNREANKTIKDKIVPKNKNKIKILDTTIIKPAAMRPTVISTSKAPITSSDKSIDIIAAAQKSQILPHIPNIVAPSNSVSKPMHKVNNNDIVTNTQVQGIDPNQVLITAVPQPVVQNVLVLGTNVCDTFSNLPIQERPDDLSNGKHKAYVNVNSDVFHAPQIVPVVVNNPITLSITNTIGTTTVTAPFSSVRTVPSTESLLQQTKVSVSSNQAELCTPPQQNITKRSKNPVRIDTNKANDFNKLISEILPATVNAELESNDFKFNRNRERTVLSQVQERQSIGTQENKDPKTRQLSSENDTMNNLKGHERLAEKRFAINNREINCRSFSPAIPLTYAPLTINKDKQTPSRNKHGLNTNNVKQDAHGLQGDNNVEYATESITETKFTETPDSPTVHLNDTEIASENTKENQDDDTLTCRRILLRSSNTLKVAPITIKRTVGTKTKVRLKVVVPETTEIEEETNIAIDKPIDIKKNIVTAEKHEELNDNAGKEETPTPTRISKRIRERKIKKSKLDKTSAKVICNKKTGRQLVENKKSEIVNNVEVTESIVKPPDADIFDVEEALLGAQIRKTENSVLTDSFKPRVKDDILVNSTTEVTENKEDQNIVTNNTVPSSEKSRLKTSEIMSNETLVTDGVSINKQTQDTEPSSLSDLHLKTTEKVSKNIDLREDKSNENVDINSPAKLLENEEIHVSPKCVEPTPVLFDLKSTETMAEDDQIKHSPDVINEEKPKISLRVVTENEEARTDDTKGTFEEPLSEVKSNKLLPKVQSEDVTASCLYNIPDGTRNNISVDIIPKVASALHQSLLEKNEAVPKDIPSKPLSGIGTDEPVSSNLSKEDTQNFDEDLEMICESEEPYKIQPVRTDKIIKASEKVTLKSTEISGQKQSINEVLVSKDKPASLILQPKLVGHLNEPTEFEKISIASIDSQLVTPETICENNEKNINPAPKSLGNCESNPAADSKNTTRNSQYFFVESSNNKVISPIPTQNISQKTNETEMSDDDVIPVDSEPESLNKLNKTACENSSKMSTETPETLGNTEDNVDMLQSYKNSITIEELQLEDNNNPFKKCVKITLPNGKVFKATVYGAVSVSFDTLFADPALKNLLLSNFNSKKHYTLNIQQLSTRSNRIVGTRIKHISIQTKPLGDNVETVNLISDDEEDISQTFTTEFGKYPIRSIDQVTFAKHQIKFSQKCLLKLNRCPSPQRSATDDATELDSEYREPLDTEPTGALDALVDAILSDVHIPVECPSDLITKIVPDVIEIDDSSNDSALVPSILTNPQPAPKINELKNLLFKDLGVEDVLNDPVTDKDAVSDLRQKNEPVENCVTPESKRTGKKAKANTGKSKKNNAPKKDYSKIIPYECYIKLVRCDEALKKRNRDNHKDNIASAICETYVQVCDTEDLLTDEEPKPELTCSGSFSIRNEINEDSSIIVPVLDSDISNRSSPEIHIASISTIHDIYENDRNSPVMEVFDMISTLYKSSDVDNDSVLQQNEIHLKTFEPITCCSDWRDTKRSLHTCNLKTLSFEVYDTRTADDIDVSTDYESDHEEVRVSDVDMTKCDSDWCTTKKSLHLFGIIDQLTTYNINEPCNNGNDLDTSTDSKMDDLTDCESNNSLSLLHSPLQFDIPVNILETTSCYSDWLETKLTLHRRNLIDLSSIPLSIEFDAVAAESIVVNANDVSTDCESDISSSLVSLEVECNVVPSLINIMSEYFKDNPIVNQLKYIRELSNYSITSPSLKLKRKWSDKSKAVETCDVELDTLSEDVGADRKKARIDTPDIETSDNLKEGDVNINSVNIVHSNKLRDQYDVVESLPSNDNMTIVAVYTTEQGNNEHVESTLENNITINDNKQRNSICEATEDSNMSNDVTTQSIVISATKVDNMTQNNDIQSVESLSDIIEPQVDSNCSPERLLEDTTDPGSNEMGEILTNTESPTKDMLNMLTTEETIQSGRNSVERETVQLRESLEPDIKCINVRTGDVDHVVSDNDSLNLEISPINGIVTHSEPHNTNYELQSHNTNLCTVESNITRGCESSQLSVHGQEFSSDNTSVLPKDIIEMTELETNYNTTAVLNEGLTNIEEKEKICNQDNSLVPNDILAIAEEKTATDNDYSSADIEESVQMIEQDKCIVSEECTEINVREPEVINDDISPEKIKEITEQTNICNDQGEYTDKICNKNSTIVPEDTKEKPLSDKDDTSTMTEDIIEGHAAVTDSCIEAEECTAITKHKSAKSEIGENIEVDDHEQITIGNEQSMAPVDVEITKFNSDEESILSSSNNQVHDDISNENIPVTGDGIEITEHEQALGVEVLEQRIEIEQEGKSNSEDTSAVLEEDIKCTEQLQITKIDTGSVELEVSIEDKQETFNIEDRSGINSFGSKQDETSDIDKSSVVNSVDIDITNHEENTNVTNNSVLPENISEHSIEHPKQETITYIGDEPVVLEETIEVTGEEEIVISCNYPVLPENNTELTQKEQLLISEDSLVFEDNTELAQQDGDNDTCSVEFVESTVLINAQSKYICDTEVFVDEVSESEMSPHDDENTTVTSAIIETRDSDADVTPTHNRNSDESAIIDYSTGLKKATIETLLASDNFDIVKETDIKTPEKSDDIDENAFENNVTLVYKDDSGVVLKGIEYEDPVMGPCYVFPLAKSSDTSGEGDMLNSSGIMMEEIQIDEYSNRSIDVSDEEDIEVQIPKVTYCKRSRKRKANMTDADISEKKPKTGSTTEVKRYRKGKKIDNPKFAPRTNYGKEYRRLVDYYTTIKFSYSVPFHRDYIDVPKLLKNWPLNGPCSNECQEEIEYCETLFVDVETIAEPFDPTKQTLAEEINAKYSEDFPSNDIEETNFSVGFGERSGRVIQNLVDGGAISNFSAATLSDVKQPQPFLLSEDYDDFEGYQNITDAKEDQMDTIKRYTTYIRLRDKVRSFFKKTTSELRDDLIKEHKKDNGKVDSSTFPFDLYIRNNIVPSPIQTVVQVVQVGQLPVSAAAQNPVTCDPRVTQVSDASPSQCSAENSPHDDSEPVIKTEYTELTTADLSLPLAHDYTQLDQVISIKPEENTNECMGSEVVPIESVLIKSEVKIELEEEPPEINEENSKSPEENIDNSEGPQSIVENHVNNVEYSYDTNISTETDTNDHILYNSPEKENISETYSQHTQNGPSEKTDQIAHAMNAAGINTTSETTDTNTEALVNVFSQKIRQDDINTAQDLPNAYSKTTSINAMALQQALAQILPPQLNQTITAENNHQVQNSQVTPQMLHIVQGENASGNQITLVDNTQQSVINAPNATQVLHIVQNKGAGPTSNGVPSQQQNAFSGLSLVDAGLQPGGNQLLHIVNTGNQKNNNTGQLLKRVNLLTNLTNAQGSSEQKMVQFVCKTADGKAIQLNASHQRSMVLRLQPIESPNIQTTPSKPIETQERGQTSTAANTAANKDSVAAQQEIKSRSVYEENYAKFIQNSKPPLLEKSTTLPKFNQAFGKPVFQADNQKQNEINSNNVHLTSINTTDSIECQPTDGSISLEHIAQIGSPPMLIRKPPDPTSQTQPNLVQQIKQTIAPINIQTMHGGVIYTRQIPVNIGGGQTINLITVPSTELIDDSGLKQATDVKFVNQADLESSIIKIVPNADISGDENNHMTNENAQNPQPVLTQMRIKLPMLSKAPQMVSGARVVRPSFFQIQRNVIGGANQPVYQQLVLTAAPPIGQQTIRLPQAQATRHIKVPSQSQSSSESQMSSSTLEQLREFDMVLEQVKERSTVQPNANPTSAFKLHAPSIDTTDSSLISASSTTTETTQQIVYSIEGSQPLNVTYVNRKSTITTTSTFVRSPDSTADPPTSSTQVRARHTVTTESPAKSQPAQPKAAKVGSKSKSHRKHSSHSHSSVKMGTAPSKAPPPKPVEDEQTTQRILYILAEYKEQVENSPDKDKPAPRRRSIPPATPSGNSKRKKGGSRRGGARDMSPVHGDDTCRTMGSEDSSCGTSQGDCAENSIEPSSPQESPRKVARKITFDQEAPLNQPRPQPQRNVIVHDGQTITVARGTAGKPTTAVLMPANYILPVSMVKGGQQIAIVTNRGPKLLTVGGEGGATNALLLQRLIGPAGLKPVLARPGVRHVRLPTAALHNLQAFNIATTAAIQPPDSTASPAPAPTPPDHAETGAESSPWTDRESDNAKPSERASSPEGSEPWNLPADPQDYIYEETVRAENMDRTVLDPIPDRYSPDLEAQRIFDKMFDVESKKSYVDSPRCGYDIDASDDDKTYHQVVQKKEVTSQRQHRLTHVSAAAAALRHKYAILEHELRLQKSLSEECEDLGVDSPSAAELFPEAELLFSGSPAHDHAHDTATHSHTPQPLMTQSTIHPEMDDQLATDQLLPRETIVQQRQDLDVNLGLEDVGIVTVSEDGMRATIELDQEEFARSHPNTTFHSEPTEEGEVQPYTIGLKRHITSTIFHSNRAPATVLMTAPHTTVISQATAEPSHSHHPVKYDLNNMISIPTHSNNINYSSVLVKDDGLTRYDSILTDSRELHLSNTASAIVHSVGNATQVIRRVCYEDDKRERERFLIDEPEAIIAGDDAKMIAEDNSRDATLESMVDDGNYSPERHAELFWESNSASERSESRRPLDYSSDSDKCCKSPSYDETNSTDSSGVGTHIRLDSVIKDTRGLDRSASAGSSADDTLRPLRTYPPKRHYQPTGEQERSLSGKTRAGERSPDSLEVRGRRASGRGVVKRGCHCCNGSPAPQRPKKPRQRKPTTDFNAN